MRRALKILLMSAMCGVPLGYVFFSTVLPNATFPTLVRVPLWAPILTAAAVGYLAGMALDGMDETVLAAFGASFFGVAFMGALLAYPLAQPSLESGSLGEIIVSGLKRTFPLILVCFIAFFITSFIGRYTSDEPGEKDFFDAKRGGSPAEETGPAVGK